MARTTCRFAWHDLVTTDPDDAARFYAELLGWTWHAPSEGFRVAAVDGRPIAGLVRVGEGGDPHWLCHVAVPDIDAVCRRIAFLQGQVLIEPHDLQGVGRSAVVADPTGAVLATLQAESAEPPDEVAGGLVLDALVAPRADLGAKLYAQLMDWKVGAPVPMREGAGYVLKARRARVGALLPAESDATGVWVPHALVDNLGAAEARATELGATLLRGAQELDGVGYVSLIADRQGVAFGLVELA